MRVSESLSARSDINSSLQSCQDVTSGCWMGCRAGEQGLSTKDDISKGKKSVFDKRIGGTLSGSCGESHYRDALTGNANQQ